MKKLLFLLLILAIPFSSAYTSLNVHLDSDGNALFLGKSDESSIKGLPTGIQYENGQLIGETQELTSKSGETWKFLFSLTDSEMQVFLPEGAKVSHVEGEISIDGNRIVIYGVGFVEVEYTIGEVKDEFNTNFGIILILALVVAVVVYLLFKEGKRTWKEKDESVDKLEAVQGVLNEREKLILNKLKETGKAKSSFLRRKTEIPKASFSRHVRELEKKGLIKISGEGRNKIIELE